MRHVRIKKVPMKLILLVFLASSYSQAALEAKGDVYCTSAKEYITTVRFLRDKKEFGLSEKQIQKTADNVSMGCNDASQRYISIMKLLTKMGVDSRSAQKHSLIFAQKTNEHTEAFIEIFKNAYNPDKMDLDVLTSLKLSLSLSADYQGNISQSVQNFKELVEFCIDNKSLDLSSPQCANLASEITINGSQFKEELIAPHFKKLIQFLQKDKKGPQLPLLKSIKIAKDLVKQGPLASKNFIQAFTFSTSKKGLNFSHKNGLEFATKMTKRSIQK